MVVREKRFSYRKRHARHRFFQITENKVKFNAFLKRTRWDVCRTWWTFYNERKLLTNATTDDYVPTQQGRTTENALYIYKNKLLKKKRRFHEIYSSDELPFVVLQNWGPHFACFYIVQLTVKDAVAVSPNIGWFP